MSDTDSMTAAELLRRAATAISEHGHTKHRLGSPDGSMCALGAVNYAENGDAERYAWSQAATDAVDAALDATRRLYGQGIVDWNNADSTTGEDVILLFKTVAEQLDEAVTS